MNVQVDGGPAASTFHRYFTKINMQNNMSCVDLCASAFIEIPDTCVMYVYTLKKYIDQHIIQILFNVLKMIEFSLVIHHVFGGVGGG